MLRPQIAVELEPTMSCRLNRVVDVNHQRVSVQRDDATTVLNFQHLNPAPPPTYSTLLSAMWGATSDM